MCLLVCFSPGRHFRCLWRVALGRARVVVLGAWRLLHLPWPCALAARRLTTRRSCVGSCQPSPRPPAHPHLVKARRREASQGPEVLALGAAATFPPYAPVVVNDLPLLSDLCNAARTRHQPSSVPLRDRPVDSSSASPCRRILARFWASPLLTPRRQRRHTHQY